MTTIFRRTLVAATTVLAALAVGTGAAAGNDRPLIDAVAAPEGFIRVTDDTGTISVAVPESWDVRTGRFNVGHDGVGFPAVPVRRRSPYRRPAGTGEPVGRPPSDSSCPEG